MVLDLAQERDLSGPGETSMEDVLARAFAMPLTNPAFPPGPYRFVDREYLIITYRADKEALEASARAAHV
jgi:acetoacetate decarboxylase